MKATDQLKHEHEIILKVLEAAEKELAHIRKAGAIRFDTLSKILDFLSNFADRCHHAKEEKLLYVRMQEKGMPLAGGPIAVMLDEHNEGRRRVKALAEALPRARAKDPAALSSVVENLSAYLSLLRAHIDKENNILYLLCDQLLTPKDDNDLLAAFEAMEAREMGAGVHEKYHQLAHDLAEENGA